MMRIGRSVFVGGAALVLALALVSCSGGAGEPAASTGEEQQAAPEPAPVTHDPKVEPNLIEPGWLYGENTSDLWWANGDTASGNAVYFTNAANDAGMAVTFVDGEGYESGVFDLEVVDGHLVTKADAGEDVRRVDFAFQGNFECYEAETDTVYIRGDRKQEDYDALLVGTSFVEDPAAPDEFTVTFEEGGVTHQYQEPYAPLEGTWEVVSTNVVVCHYASDASSWDTEYRFEIGADGIIAELDSGAPNKLKRYEQ